MMRKIFLLLFIIAAFTTKAQNTNKLSEQNIVYTFDLNREIDAAAARIVSKNISAAEKGNADYIIMRLNTYGGALDAADSIRTRFINCKIPIIVFIDNQAASAGALISIAADSIYMRSGGNIGAATVVDQSGEVLPDKYQSFMRSMMRSTAESQGKHRIVKNGDTIEVWRRNPQIAEAMVDQRIKIEGIIDSGKVLTFTTDEAILNGYCEGKAENINEVIEQAHIKNAQIIEHHQSFLDSVISFLLSPAIRGLLIMLMFGGIYFELQTPGIGFPLAAAVFGAVLFFAPSYLEGLAENWEIIAFVVGVLLLLVEVFVIPGFGIAGVSGIALIIFSLTMSMIDNNIFNNNYTWSLGDIVKPAAIVVTAILLTIAMILFLAPKLLDAERFPRISLKTKLNKDEGFISVENTEKQLVGQIGKTITRLAPSGKIEVNGEVYTAIAEYGYINIDENVIVTRFETGQLYCEIKK